MKPKNYSLIAVLFCAGVTLTLFQNCSKVAVSDAQDSGVSGKGIENPMVARDGDGNLIPVDVSHPGDMVPPNSDPAGEHEVVVGGDSPGAPAPEPSPVPAPGPAPAPAPAPAPEPGKVPSVEDLIADCGLNPESIHSVIDVAQFKDKDADLGAIQGKTLIYSSDPEMAVKSLTIDAAVGRTILCHANVDMLSVKKGRLEVYYSEIKAIGEQHGKLIKGAGAILPAGF